MKRLILCCDGTWNRADQETNGTPCPTNVIKLAYRIAKKDGDIHQVIFYDQGVGTGNWLDKYVGGATGAGLENNIHDAYIFLLANYEPGDEIYLIGFSRGAFTARSIAGMIRKCGILERTAVRHYAAAEALYHNDHVHPDDPQAANFRRDHSIGGDSETPIQMIAVFDTVGALGIPLRGVRALDKAEYQFHDTELSGTVRYGFHALAIDERRAPFQPTLWKQKPKKNQTVRQVWFAGVHSDIGGGYAETFLSDVTLEWMIARAKEAGLCFASEVLEAYPTYPKPTGLLHDSMSTLYKLQAPYARPIEFVDFSDPAANVVWQQAVHQSVCDRVDNDPTYRPANLVSYLQNFGKKFVQQ